MITRIWHGTTSLENAGKYLEILKSKGTDEYRETTGNLSVKIWKQVTGKKCHFWTVTEWKNIDAIRSFAGEEYEKAKYYPQDKGLLTTFEEKVTHYESYDVSDIKISEIIRQLRELYLGGSWQGEFFIDKLEYFDEGSAFLQPEEGIHSAAEIVWHCIYWRNVVINAILGDYNYRERTMEELNFLPHASLVAKGWIVLKSEFEKSEQRLIELLYKKTDSFLQEEYTRGKSFGYLLEGIVQHDIYHLGQLGLIIALLKKKNLLHENNNRSTVLNG